MLTIEREHAASCGLAQVSNPALEQGIRPPWQQRQLVCPFHHPFLSTLQHKVSCWHISLPQVQRWDSEAADKVRGSSSPSFAALFSHSVTPADVDMSRTKHWMLTVFWQHTWTLGMEERTINSREAYCRADFSNDSWMAGASGTLWWLQLHHLQPTPHESLPSPQTPSSINRAVLSSSCAQFFHFQVSVVASGLEVVLSLSGRPKPMLLTGLARSRVFPLHLED